MGNNYTDSGDYDDSFEFGYCGKYAILTHSSRSQCFHCGSPVAFAEEWALGQPSCPKIIYECETRHERFVR